MTYRDKLFESIPIRSPVQYHPSSHIKPIKVEYLRNLNSILFLKSRKLKEFVMKSFKAMYGFMFCRLYREPPITIVAFTFSATKSMLFTRDGLCFINKMHRACQMLLVFLNSFFFFSICLQNKNNLIDESISLYPMLRIFFESGGKVLTR